MEFALSVFIDVLECERRYLALNLCNNERLALVMLLSFRGRDEWSTSLTFDMHPSHTRNTMAFSPPTSCFILKAIAIALPAKRKLRPECAITNASRLPFLSA
jgi:hypothetical protein